MTSDFFGTQGKKYQAITADPPWTFEVHSEKGKDRSAEQHYKTMTLSDVQALPVSDIAAKDCVLFLWVTMPNLVQGIETMQAWGFEYKTVAFTWVKRNKNYSGFFMGLGYWTRANAELCLLGTRGNPKRINADVKQLIMSPLREHSRKPDEVYPCVERLVPGPYMELFARQRYSEKWDCWGNQTDKFKKRGALNVGVPE